MPLPPAPTKRAALLSPDVLDAPVRASARAPRKSSKPVELASQPAAIGLLESRPVMEVDHPIIYAEKKVLSAMDTEVVSSQKEIVPRAQPAFRP